MDYTQVIVTLISVFGSTVIWKYLENRYKLKIDKEKYDAKLDQEKFKVLKKDDLEYRDDLKDRVKNLETLLAQSSEEKDLLREQILTLTAEVYALRVKVEFLEKENERLKSNHV